MQAGRRSWQGLGIVAWALVLVAAAAGCRTGTTPGAATSAPAPPMTPAAEDCGVAPADVQRPNVDGAVHVVRGSSGLDCAEAFRVIDRWKVTDGGRSAGFHREFEDWSCFAADDRPDPPPGAVRRLTCERSDGARVYLDWW